MPTYRNDNNGNLKADELKEIRREEAAERQAEHNKLTIEQKIAKLDKRLGKGKGAKKERARLAKLLKEVSE